MWKSEIAQYFPKCQRKWICPIVQSHSIVNYITVQYKIFFLPSFTFSWHGCICFCCCCTSFFLVQHNEKSFDRLSMPPHLLIYTHREINHWNERWKGRRYIIAISIVSLKIYKRCFFSYLFIFLLQLALIHFSLVLFFLFLHHLLHQSK